MTIIRTSRVVESGSLTDLRHLTRTSITAELSSEPVGLADLPGVHDLTLDGTTVRCHVDPSSLDDLLGRLGAAGVRSLVSRPPTLEELFLRLYTDDASDGTNGSDQGR